MIAHAIDHAVHGDWLPLCALVLLLIAYAFLIVIGILFLERS